ncbi:MAG: hypothetical protein CRU78_13745 [Candidatus Accumulibacter phosphatis]|uniref:Uncharacterized protein n=1 Tax=Candidatus Accumulibacter phosphatis TaxID=327160 RepID=A0A6A7RVR3_9PROT|nr:hypothetical protein [Candidatus Accumulibacter phosphatis]
MPQLLGNAAQTAATPHARTMTTTAGGGAAWRQAALKLLIVAKPLRRTENTCFSALNKRNNAQFAAFL